MAAGDARDFFSVFPSAASPSFTSSAAGAARFLGGRPRRAAGGGEGLGAEGDASTAADAASVTTSLDGDVVEVETRDEEVGGEAEGAAVCSSSDMLLTRQGSLRHAEDARASEIAVVLASDCAARMQQAGGMRCCDVKRERLTAVTAWDSRVSHSALTLRLSAASSRRFQSSVALRPPHSTAPLQLPPWLPPASRSAPATVTLLSLCQSALCTTSTPHRLSRQHLLCCRCSICDTTSTSCSGCPSGASPMVLYHHAARSHLCGEAAMFPVRQFSHEHGREWTGVAASSHTERRPPPLTRLDASSRVLCALSLLVVVDVRWRCDLLCRLSSKGWTATAGTGVDLRWGVDIRRLVHMPLHARSTCHHGSHLPALPWTALRDSRACREPPRSLASARRIHPSSQRLILQHSNSCSIRCLSCGCPTL